MEQIISLMEELDVFLPSVVSSVLSCLFGLVIMIIQIKKYRLQSLNKKEGDNMKYRTDCYLTEKGAPKYAQSFKRVVPVYDLDEKNNSLVVVGTKDLQELINSYRDCGLDVILEKYGVLPETLLPKTPRDVSSDVFDASDLRDDLEVLCDYSAELDFLRERYQMPLASVDDLLKHIQTLKSNADKSIQDNLAMQVSNLRASDSVASAAASKEVKNNG